MILNDKLHVAIVGGTSGIGAGTARYLNNLGCLVTSLGRTERSNEYKHIYCDVSDENSTYSAFNEIPDARVLVITSGIPSAIRTLDKNGNAISNEDFVRTINVNLIGTYNAIKAFAQNCSKLDLTENGERGVIIMTSSIAWNEGKTGQVAYSASKAGVSAMTLPLARDLSRYGIRVCTISPGIFDTPMVDTLSKDAKDSISQSVLFPKRMGEPYEFGSLVSHIIQNQYINAEVIRLDGGLRL